VLARRLLKPISMMPSWFNSEHALASLLSIAAHLAVLLALAVPGWALAADGETHLVLEGKVTVTVEVVRPVEVAPPAVVLEAERPRSLRPLRYEIDRAEPLPGSLATLEAVAQALLAEPSVQLRIEAHTDDLGSGVTNAELSRRRAAWVQQWLAERGVPSSRLSAEGFGASRPVAPNDSEAGRQLNRRVELVLASR
jgi:outer membrane protein OmpA-like peptidoglycan-associated protein